MEQHSRPSTALFDVYLRLRPSAATGRERFLDVEHIENSLPTHITIKPPADDHRKRAIEKFAFTSVFEEDAGQRELFESTGTVQLVEGVLGAKGCEGRDGLVATLGVTGSGKSHTILGSKSQRGVTQLTLDVLFQHTTPHLVDIDRSATIFQSLCAADVSEGQLFPAAAFLDSIYSDNCALSRGATPARGTTPALVRDETPSSLSIPGAFPSQETHNTRSAKAASACLYPSLAKYQNPSSLQSPSKIAAHALSRLAHAVPSISKLTSTEQEPSFLSAPYNGSRRHAPRISSLPTSPSINDINLNIDTTAEYAIIISMYEVHNDRIFDLLASTVAAKSPHSLKRRALLFKSTELSPDRKVVAGLKKIVCSDYEEALLVLETGLQERRIAGTGTNAVSSRSHGFFCIEVKKRHRGTLPGPWTSSTLTIVDLAGSERARTAKTAGATLAEAGKINESLMYLGQCMQMQSDNATATSAAPHLVPFRQCKLTELLFSNSLAATQQQQGNMIPQKTPQKAIMIVTADPLGDFNATSQILRYSALAKVVTVPRVPSVTSTILAGAGARPGSSSSRPTTPSALAEELEHALTEVARLREELEVSQLMLQEETQRRQEAERSWKVAESRMEGIEVEVREEVWNEMESRLQLEQRRWLAARDVEMEAQEEHLDRKLDILTRGLSVYEDCDDDYDDKENQEEDGSVIYCCDRDEEEGVMELEAENARLREQMACLEREKEGMRSPSKKMRVLKSRKWNGSEIGLEDV